MSSKKSSRNMRSSRKKNQVSNDTEDPKVFILAPNILEKLGINLGAKSKSNVKETITSPVIKHTYSHKRKSNADNLQEPKGVGTSLSETADLMKKSVLLSPTFTSNAIEPLSPKCNEIIDPRINDNESIHENVIAAPVIDNVKNIQLIEPTSSHAIAKENKSVQENIDKSSSNNKKYLNSEVFPSKMVNDDNCNVISTGKDDFVFKVPYAQDSNMTGIEVSDPCTNRLKEKTRIKTVENISPAAVPISYSDPISSVIQEDLQSRMKLNNGLQDNNHNKRNDTIDTACKILEDKIIIQDSKRELTKSVNKKLIHNNAASINYDEKLTQSSGQSDTLPTDAFCVQNTETPETDQLGLHENKSDNKKLTYDKVKEIADYLGQCVKKTSSHLNRNKDVSKLSIQGVEKPGGMLEVNKVGNKSYHRKKSNETTTNKAITDTKVLANLNTPANDIDYAESESVSIEQVFCICHDFGSYNNLDEQIHFGENVSLNVNKEILFEIYNDEVEDYTCAKTIDKEFSESDIGTSICWSAFGLKNITDINCDVNHSQGDPILNKSNTNHGTPKSEVNSDKSVNCEDSIEVSEKLLRRNIKKKRNCEDTSKDIIKKNDVANNELLTPEKSSKAKSADKILEKSITIKNTQKTKQSQMDIRSYIKLLGPKEKVSTENKRKKRKISDDQSQKNPEKKSIRCGVCDVALSEDIWEKHKEDQHCYIAWRCGEVFDLKADSLQRKLDTRVNIGKTLNCTFCNFKIKSTSTFIKHMVKCLNSKIKFDGDTGSETLPKLQENTDGNRERKERDVGISQNNQLSENDIETFIAQEDPVSANDYIDICSGDIEIETLVCGVCQENVATTEWCKHIADKHNYLAWKKGENAININDDEQVQQLLQSLSKDYNGLSCSKCDTLYKSAEDYSKHIKSCHQSVPSENQSLTNTFLDQTDAALNDVEMSNCEETVSNENHDISNTSLEFGDISMISKETAIEEEDQSLSSLKKLKEKAATKDCNKTKVKCGVCLDETSDWIDHICKKHKYIAWKDGESPVYCYNEVDMRSHLKNVIKDLETLTCYNCGLSRKQVGAYLKHIKNCDANISFNWSIRTEVAYKCGVCSEEVLPDDWMEHVMNKHDYIAWKDNEDPLDMQNEEEIRNYLLTVSKQLGGLKCKTCGIVRKYPKQFMAHIKICGKEVSPDTLTGSKFEAYQNNIDDTNDSFVKTYKCGVCELEVDSTQWINHIAKEHQYIAWKKGDKPLDVNNEEEIRFHLREISKATGGLKCSKCGIIRKSAKPFLDHIKSCTEENQEEESDSDTDVPEDVKCGVCKKEMKTVDWIKHIEKKHNYLAWWDIEEPLNLEDQEEVHEHLRQIINSNDGLKCVKCDFHVKKSPQRFLDHIKTDCTKLDNNKIYIKKQSKKQGEEKVREKEVECARCHVKVDRADWSDHAMTKHYNVAWTVGDKPIDVKNHNAVNKYLVQYLKKNHVYKCKVCGITRVSSYGFYAHIIVCGKSDEETELFKELCEICNSKYLCVYKSQHMTAHKESVLNKLRREAAKECNDRIEEPIDTSVVSGKRRAAQKAISIIGNITSEADDDGAKDFSDSDESVNLDLEESDDTESEVDSNISDQEFEERTSLAVAEKSHGFSSENNTDHAKTMPFVIGDQEAFLTQSAKDFANTYYTDEVLFPQWRGCEINILDESSVTEYLPKLKESCLITIDSNRISIKRFEATTGINRHLGSYLFTGGSVHQCCWVPAAADGGVPGDVTDSGDIDISDSFLSVLCHVAGDAPRLAHDSLAAARGCMQIWNCGQFRLNQLSYLNMVLIHDYGVIWSIAWCPSGARDANIDSSVFQDESKSRLGLMAAACSNGQAYIFCVPYPVTKDEIMYCKPKPVAELRMTSSTERKAYQATAVNWSKSKGHDTILVGYADGTVCYYDITSTSPLLTAREDGVDVFYPYHEMKASTGCITAVDSFPAPSAGGGAVCAGGAAGAALRSRPARPAPGAAPPPPAAHMRMSRHWPGAYVAGDCSILSSAAVHEIDFWGASRRLGLVASLTECGHCGLVATYTNHLIRLMTPYPALTELNRKTLLSIDVAPLAKKRKLQSDELGVVTEPLTYEEAIEKYAIVLQRFKSRNDVPTQKRPQDVCIERFPLCNVTSMEFCSSAKHHDKLAICLHAGIIIILSVR